MKILKEVWESTLDLHSLLYSRDVLAKKKKQGKYLHLKFTQVA